MMNERMGGEMRKKMVGEEKEGKMEVNVLSETNRPGRLGRSSVTGQGGFGGFVGWISDPYKKRGKKVRMERHHEGLVFI